MAKSRTAPLQHVSVPRLELQAATIAVHDHAMILKEIDLNISLTFFWTDSKITLQYINNVSRRFKTYVPNLKTHPMLSVHTIQEEFTEQSPVSLNLCLRELGSSVFVTDECG